MRDLTRKPQFPAITHLAATSLAALLLAGGIVTQAAADVTTCIGQPPALDGWESVMVTFDPNVDLCGGTDPCERFAPITDYRGVDYETLISDSMSLVFGDSDYGMDFPTGIPVVRNLTAPLLATICIDEGGCPSMRLRLTFKDPTPFFGFSYGFNDMNQDQDGTSTRNIGKVILYNEDGRVIRRAKLKASRLYCCTEGRFDFTAKGISHHNHRFVAMAEIEFEYDYIPFMPGSGSLVGPKFFGIDNVSYAIPSDASEVCPPEAQ